MLKLEERLTEMEKRNEEQNIERAMTGNLVFPFWSWSYSRVTNTPAAKKQL